MSLFGAVRLYLVSHEAADRTSTMAGGPAGEETPYSPKPGAWRRWSVAGTGASEAARNRRRVEQGLIPESLRPRVRLRP